MPTFEFTNAEGEVFEVTAPEGATEQQAFEMLQRQQAQQTSVSPVLESVPGRFAAGVAQPAIEFTAGITPPERMGPTREPVLERARRPGGLPKTLGRFTGEVGLMAGPASAAYGGTRALTRAVPWVRHWAPLAAESGVVGGLEYAKAPEEGQTRGERALQASLTNFGIGAGIGALSRAWKPRMFPKSEAAVREEASQRAVGVKPKLPLSVAAEPTGPVGNVLQWMHRQPLRALPGTSKVMRGQTDKAVDLWRESMFMRAMPESARGRVAMPRQRKGAEAPLQDTFKDIDNWYKMEYREILDPYNFKLTTGPNADRLAQAYQGIPESGARREVTEKLGDYIQNLADEGGTLSGSAISSLKTRIRNAMRLADDADVKAGWADVIESLDDIVEGSLRQLNPDYAVRYAALREPYRNLVTLERAASRQGGKYAEFDPDDVYAASIGKTKREAGERRVAQGRGPLQAESQRMSRLMEPVPRKQQESNIFQTQAFTGTMTAGAGAAGMVMEPVTTSAILGGVGLSMPRFGQKYLMGEYDWQRPAQRLRESPYMQELARALRIGAATAE